jgi:hypothetical protein
MKKHSMCFVETMPQRTRCPLTPALSPEGEREVRSLDAKS